MKEPGVLNPNIVPLKFPARGRHPETSLQGDIDTFFTQFGIQRVDMPIITTDFFTFDFLGMPEYSPVRSADNIIRLDDGATTDQETPPEIIDIIAKLHQMRFGLPLPSTDRNRNLLVSHTTAQLVANLCEHGPREIYTISKTFREKKEKREKTQVEAVLVDRSVPEIIAFVEKLYSCLTGNAVNLQLFSDFYYFLEPSFSFSTMVDGKARSIGSAGFARTEVMDVMRRMHPDMNARTIAFVGIPYQKLLNLRLGEKFDNLDIDYNYK